MTLKLITADEARERYKEEKYLTSLDDVAKAIAESAEHTHEVIVNIPTGIYDRGFSSAYYVMKTLCRLGYDVVMHHDSENGSSELVVNWR